jgi:hypothetical protein
LVTRCDHRIGIIQPQRHRLFDNDMLASPGREDGMFGVHSAGSKHDHHLDIRVTQHLL